MAARQKKRWKTILPTVTLTAIPFVVNMPSASAFFPPLVPPTGGVVVPPVIPPIVVPPVVPPIVVPPVCDGGGPHCVPEPATIITAAMGLAAMAGYGRLRRKDEKNPTETTES